MQKNFLIWLLGTVLIFSNAVYPCAHNFEGEISGVGYAYFHSKKIRRFELIAGDVEKDKHPLKIYFVKHGSKVNLLSPGKMNLKDPVTHQSPLDNFKFIEKEMKVLDQRAGVSRGSSEVIKYNVEKVGNWEVMWARYNATDETSIDVEDGRVQSVESKELFSYLMKLHGFASTHEAQMNQSLSEGLKIGYDIIVIEGKPIKSVQAKQTNLAVQFMTPLSSRSSKNHPQEFFEEMMRVKTLDYFISSKGMYGFWMPQIDVNLTEEMLAMNDCQELNKNNCDFKKRIANHIFYKGPWDQEPSVEEMTVVDPITYKTTVKTVNDPGTRILKPEKNKDKEYLQRIWERAYFFDYCRARFKGVSDFNTNELNFTQFSKDAPETSLLFFRMYPMVQETGAQMLLFQSR